MKHRDARSALALNRSANLEAAWDYDDRLHAVYGAGRKMSPDAPGPVGRLISSPGRPGHDSGPSAPRWLLNPRPKVRPRAGPTLRRFGKLHLGTGASSRLRGSVVRTLRGPSLRDMFGPLPKRYGHALGYSPQPVFNRRKRESTMIGFIVFGLVVGILARVLVPGHQHLSVWMTLLLGLVGSVVGGLVANALGTGDIFELNVLGSLVAIAAAVALVVAGDRLGVLSKRSGQ